MDLTALKNKLRMMKLSGMDTSIKEIKTISENVVSLTEAQLSDVPYEYKMVIEDKVHVMDFENNKLVLKPVKLDFEDNNPPKTNKKKDYEKDGGDAVKMNKKMIDNDLSESSVDGTVFNVDGNDPFTDEERDEYFGKSETKSVSVKVPRAILTTINNTINDIEDSIDQEDDKGYNDGDGANSNKNKAIDALEQIKQNLKSKDYEGFRKAQQFFLTLMSPITDLFPASVVNFLANGEEASLASGNTFSEVKPFETELKESQMDATRKTIPVTYEIVSPESAEIGDAEDRGWEDGEGFDATPDSHDIQDGVTAVDKAVEYLANMGAVHPSAGPSYSGGSLWFSDEGTEDYQTANVKTLSYHLKGFTEEEQEEIYNRVTGKVTEAVDMPKQLTSLNEVYPEGNTQVWYMKPEFFRDGTMGYNFLRKLNKLPDPRNLEKTHELLGKIAETDSEKIYMMMQGENWSPKGEAKTLVRAKGLRHTSMTIGDVVIVDGQPHLVDNSGFKPLAKNSLSESVMYTNKAGFDRYFRSEVLPTILKRYGTDKPAIRQAYIDMIDGLVRDGQLPEYAVDWVVPSSFENAKLPAITESKKLSSYVVEAKKKRKKMVDNPCWDGYTMVGMKKKDGKDVPNCVPDGKD